MKESEKNKYIKLLLDEFYAEADKLAKEEQPSKGNVLDNGRTKYTDLYEKYKEKIDNIKNS